MLALLTIAAPAQAYSVSAEVGPLLNEAKALMSAKDYEGAMAKVNEAEAVKSWPDDAYVIDQFRKAIEIASSHPSQSQP